MPAQDFEFRIQPHVLPPIYADGSAPYASANSRWHSDINWGAVAAALLIAVAIVVGALLWKGTTRWGDCDVNCARLWTTLWQHESDRHKVSSQAQVAVAAVGAHTAIQQAQAAQNIAASLPVIAPVAGARVSQAATAAGKPCPRRDGTIGREGIGPGPGGRPVLGCWKR